MKQATSIEAAAAPYSAIPVWDLLPIQAGATGPAVGEQAQPIAPSFRVFKRFESGAYVGNANRHFSGPRALAVLPLQIGLMPSSASPLFLTTNISMPGSRKTPGNLPIPESSRQAAINLASESGLIEGLPPGLGLPAAFPVDPVVQAEKGAWRAAACRPSAPNGASLGAISFPPKGCSSRSLSRSPAARQRKQGAASAMVCLDATYPVARGFRFFIAAHGSFFNSIDGGIGGFWNMER